MGRPLQAATAPQLGKRQTPHPRGYSLPHPQEPCWPHPESWPLQKPNFWVWTVSGRVSDGRGGGLSSPLSQEPDWCFPRMEELKLPVSSRSHWTAYGNFCPAKDREIVRDTIRGVALRQENTPTNFPEIWTVPPPHWRARFRQRPFRNSLFSY